MDDGLTQPPTHPPTHRPRGEYRDTGDWDERGTRVHHLNSEVERHRFHFEVPWCRHDPICSGGPGSSESHKKTRYPGSGGTQCHNRSLGPASLHGLGQDLRGRRESPYRSSATGGGCTRSNYTHTPTPEIFGGRTHPVWNSDPFSTDTCTRLGTRTHTVISVRRGPTNPCHRSVR